MNPDVAFLSIKALAVLGASSVLAVSEPLLEKIPVLSESGFLEYGVLGIACVGLIYAIKTLHTINQQLLRDRITDIKEAERLRLVDRDTFFDRLDALFKSSEASRDHLAQRIDHLLDNIKKP